MCRGKCGNGASLVKDIIKSTPSDLLCPGMIGIVMGIVAFLVDWGIEVH